MKNKRSSTNITRYVILHTLKEKIKYFLREEYKKGKFFSIPKDLLELEDPEDQRFRLELKNYFENTKSEFITVPENLYKDPEEREQLIQTLKKYNDDDKKYLSLGNFNYEHFSTQEKEELEQIKKHCDEKFENIKSDVKICCVRRIVYRNAQEFKISRLVGNPHIEKTLVANLKNKNSYKKVKHIKEVEQVNNEMRELELIQKTSKGQLMRRAILNFGYRRAFKNIERSFDDYLFFEIQDFLKHKFSQLDEFDIKKVGESNNTTSKFKSQRDLLINILKNLKITGVLDDLINQENENIELFEKYMNNDKEKFVPFHRASKESMIKYIEALDLEKPQGVIELNVYLMHFISKLAIAHKEFAISSMKRNSITEKDYKSKSEKIIKAREEHYIDVCTKYWEDPNEFNYEYVSRQLSKIIGKKQVDLFISNIPRLSKEHIAQKVKKLLKDEKVPEIRKYQTLDSYEENLYNKLKDLYREYNDCVNLERKNTMNTETFSNIFNNVIDAYYEEIGKFKGANSNLRINKRLLCIREKRNLYRRIQQEDEDGDKALVGVKRKNGEEFIHAIIEEIERLEKDGVLHNIQVSLKRVVSQIELNDKLYQAKDYYRNSIINAYRLFPEIISVRNDVDSKDIKYSHVDIMVPGKLHFFRTRYNRNNETDRLVISCLPQITENVSDCFTKPGCSFLITYVPTDNFTQEQIKRMEECYNTMKYIDSRPESFLKTKEVNLFNLEKLIELKKTNPNFYEMLKLKTSLYKQAEFRRENTCFPKMPKELEDGKKEVAETISKLQESNRWSDRDLFTRFIHIKDKDVVRYCIQRAQYKRFEKELLVNKIELPVNLAFFHDQKSDDYFVEEIIKNGNFMKALSYIEKVRESMRCRNNLSQDKAAEEMHDD